MCCNNYFWRYKLSWLALENLHLFSINKSSSFTLKVISVKMKAGTWKLQHNWSSCFQLFPVWHGNSSRFHFRKHSFLQTSNTCSCCQHKNYLETDTIIAVIICTITLQEIDESFVPEAGKFVWIYPIYVLDKVIHPNK